MRRRDSLVLTQTSTHCIDSTSENTDTKQQQRQQQRWYTSPFFARVISTCKRTASLSKKRVYSDENGTEADSKKSKVKKHVLASSTPRPDAPAAAANRRKRPRPFSADFTGLFCKHPPEDDAIFRPSSSSSAPPGVFRRLSLFVSEPVIAPSKKQQHPLQKNTPPSGEAGFPLMMTSSIAQQRPTQANADMVLSAAAPSSREAAEMAKFVREKQNMAVTHWYQQEALDNHPAKILISPTTDGNDNQQRDGSLCVFILNELYMTELSYHKLLTHMQQNYMQPMKTAIRNRDPLILAAKRSGHSCTRDIHLLFDHLPGLIRLSTRILGLLYGAVDVASGFLALKYELTLFLKYAIHYQTYFRAIRKACQTNPFLLAMEKTSLSRRETNRMGLSDYLIAPIQRVPRYCLLFHDWLKHTPATDPAYSDIHACFQLVTSLASVMNMYSI
ncbi:Dbl homology domain-containing protein [Dichotomocladium elegans]|nr:Dbl homology domain-containing protein [Dichotomocladium elegans]